MSIVALALAWLVFGERRSPVRVVVESEIYRSGQLDPESLRAAVHEHGVRSILNLRGAAPGSGWYEAERLEARALGVRHVDLRMSGDRLPSRSELAGLVGLLDELERPILFHCLAGQDRSGLAEAVVSLLAGGSLREAREATRISLGSLGVGHSALVGYVEQYADWLHASGLDHNGAQAREYALVHYVPGLYAAEVTLLSFPDEFVASEPYSARFRIENRSRLPWQLTDGRLDQGIHLGLRVERLEPSPIPPCEGRGFTPEATLGPGQTLELTMNLPVLDHPGSYRLHFDLVNESEAWFADRSGSPPIVRNIQVEQRDATAPPPPPADDFVRCDDP